ncbi:hypothetical protein C173_20416 [Paenibacillus sp. FSL R7-277]|uniref:acyl carrier protein n=1 Tax=unclassified Paenibacillus TaxID=185978 RepID=UPI0003E22F40|nr:acyl carrier protein [Paenibacillus sp. FSL R7-277]ETT65429.1 hypothetical protein C173_20416 [Paenibacillus sp. FSL R7-277]
MGDEQMLLELKAILEDLNIEGVDSIQVNDSLADYGLNSAGLLRLILAVEEQFGFQFKDEDFDSENFETLESLITYIARRKEDSHE